MHRFARLLILVALALLPLTSFAARAGTIDDLASSAVELEQALPHNPGGRLAPAQQHRHCSLWTAVEASCAINGADNGPSAGLSLAPGAALIRFHGPEAATPPPRA